MPIDVYAFSNRPDARGHSSSGGAFPALAQAFFDMEPTRPHAVYGVRLNREVMPVYDRATTLADCARFQGSKYVRADLAGAYTRVETDLKAGSLVLFVGTPCLVDGLRRHVKRTNSPEDGLFCLDLICHGTPAPAYWEAYKHWLEKTYKSRLTDYAFRSRRPGARPYAAEAVFDKRTVTDDLAISLYNRLFLRHYLFVPGCFDCPFANMDRRGDITLGDFWGIEEVMPDFPQRQHVSEVLINTKKGAALMEGVKNQNTACGYTLARCESDGYIKYQNNLNKPADKPVDYDRFQADYKAHGLPYVLKKYAHYDLPHRIKHRLTGGK